jgi:cysteinyl-tRNA synthetase
MIKFYNTLLRKRVEFTQISENKVGLYTCGPTVYDYAHIGNFRAYIFEDLLRRFLEFSGNEVLHVMNITDIDDKTIRRSKEEGLSLKEFTDTYTNAFFEDIEKLNIVPAHHYPRATDFVPQMIEMIQSLEEKGFTYTTKDGSVFFKIDEYSDYGKLANIDPCQLISGERVENDEYEKEECRDFALWKGLKESEGDVYWDSPWGKGRPGWHIECSAMSVHYLGDHFDIHCGGVDNIFPHHENEIAQSCASTGAQFVNYWLHNEHLLVDGQKMSKSLGNFYTLRDLIEKGCSLEALRYTLLSTHYRQKLNFTFDKVEVSQKAINRLRELVRRLELVEEVDVADDSLMQTSIERKFDEKLADDLNISGALGELFTWANNLFSALDNNKVDIKFKEIALNSLRKIDSVLGVVFTDDKVTLTDEVEKLILDRNNARKSKNWQLADEIRDKLDKMNIVLEDTPKGTIWKKK